MVFGFRNPADVVKGRIDAKVNRKMYDAQVGARRAVEGKARGAVSKAKGKPKPAAPAAKKKKAKKAKMGWWPFGEKEDESGGPACPNCNAEVDPTWAACPYCQTQLGAASSAPAMVPNVGNPGPVGPNMAAPASNRTMAIDLDQLAAPKKSVRGWLVVIEGQQKGTDFRLYGGVNRLGAGADNDIVVTDEYLSANHAEIRIDDNAYEFIDHGSTNGSFVNDRRVSKEEVIDNDRIRLGRTEFRIKTLLEY
jgi:hypothetical protein